MLFDILCQMSKNSCYGCNFTEDSYAITGQRIIRTTWPSVHLFAYLRKQQPKNYNVIDEAALSVNFT
jgi:hypothetical protein